MKTDIQFRVRFYRDDDIAIGPGKVSLLEAQNHELLTRNKQLEVERAELLARVKLLTSELKIAATELEKAGVANRELQEYSASLKDEFEKATNRLAECEALLKKNQLM